MVLCYSTASCSEWEHEVVDVLAELTGTWILGRPENVDELRRLMAGVDSIGETFFSSNRRFDTSSYTGQRAQPNIDVRLRIHEDNRRGLDDGSWRIGASDLMPLDFSTWTNDYVAGPFWQGMIDWADRKKPIAEILADIQTARENYDAEQAG